MNKRTKLIVSGICGLMGGYLLATVVGFAKLMSLGKTEWTGDAKFLFVPVMHIENHAKGFVASTRYGVFVVALVAAVVAVLFASYANKRKPI